MGTVVHALCGRRRYFRRQREQRRQGQREWFAVVGPGEGPRAPVVLFQTFSVLEVVSSVGCWLETGRW